MEAATATALAGLGLFAAGTALGFFIAQRRLVKQHEEVLGSVTRLAEQRKALLQQGTEVRLALGIDPAEQHAVVLDSIRMLRDGLPMDVQGRL